MTATTTDLKSRLNDPTLLATQAYVAGAWIDADNGATFPVSNPARGDVIARVADMSRSEVARAIAAADVAGKAWAKRTAKERAQIMRRWYELMMENQADLAMILTAEMGKPLAEAMGEIAYGASFIEWFAEEGRRIYGETIPGHMPDKRITVIKQPIGVAASITPWNFPNAMRPGHCRRLRLCRPPGRADPPVGAGAGGAGRTRWSAGRAVQRGAQLQRLGNRQGVLREPDRAQADLYRLDQRGPHPAASGGGSGDEMLDGAGRQRALHRL